jgi:hypothetical protein
MSFYKDREEEEKGEEAVDVKEEEKEFVFV